MINSVSQNIQVVNKNVNKTKKIKNKNQTRVSIKELPNYPLSFLSSQIQQYSKGSTPYVAQQLKSLNGTLDEKITQAKDIILKDMNLPTDMVKCVDEDLGGSGYAAFSPALGKIIIDKKFCQQPSAQFLPEALMCILRHEIDHLEVFSKLYKKLGRDEFEKLVLGSEILVGMLPKEKRKINHEFYSQMSKYVNVDDFQAEKYVDAIKNYYLATLGNSPYKNFVGITKNFNNALESSAQDKQYQLERQMGVSTLENFYSMIDETKKFISEIKAKDILSEANIEQVFNKYYAQSAQSANLEDTVQNWSKIIQKARLLNKEQVV